VAWQPGTSIGVELGHVSSALAADHPVVAEGRPFSLDGRREDLADRTVQCGRSFPSDPSRAGVDPSPPQRLVGIDVADPGDDPLVEQAGLHRRPVLTQPCGERGGVEAFRQWLWAELGQGRDVGEVAAGIDDRDATEASGVTEDEHATVIEQEAHTDVGRATDRTLRVVGVEDPQHPGHAQMQDQLRRVRRSLALERHEQELPPPADLTEPAADRPCHCSDATRRVGVSGGSSDRAPLDQRRQLASDGLDLGELWHALRLAMASDLTGIVPASLRSITSAEVVMGERDRRDDGRPEQARPRDRTGRPLPYGSVGVATTGPIETDDPARALELGTIRWHEQRYFEAHELLEIVWKATVGPERELWKGIIQVAVACVHVQRGNPVGAERLLARALHRLDTFAERHAGAHGVVDVAEVRRQARVLAGRLATTERPSAVLDVDLGPLPVGPR
jgi:uncharacterized protein